MPASGALGGVATQDGNDGMPSQIVYKKNNLPALVRAKVKHFKRAPTTDSALYGL